MAVPDYQSFMRPLLAFGADGSERNINDAISALADQFGLTDEDREVQYPSGDRILSNRVHWARTYLDKAGALRRTRRSHFVVTERGRALLDQCPERIDVRALRQFPEFVAFQTPKVVQGEDVEVSDRAEPPQELVSATPEEAIQAAEATIAANLRGQLLERIAELSPTFFERLVVDLIVAMGYGGDRQTRRTTR